jgi:hypothetical protein
MFDFKKVAMFAVASLGLVGIASAQTSTITGFTAPVVPVVSVEGTTEALPTVVVNLAPAGPMNSATLVLTANVPFVNAVATGSLTGALDVVATANGPVVASSVTQSGNTTTIVFNMASTALTSITVTGLRVNANSVPSSSQVTLSASGVAGGGILGSAAALPFANVLTSLVPSTLAASASVSLCTATTTAVSAVTTLTIQENFAAAFKTTAESAVAGSNAAARGTRFAVTFNNLNAAVNYYVYGAITTATPGAGATSAGVTLTAYTTATGTTAATTVSVGTPAVAGLVLLAPVNGSATIYYATTADNAGTIDTAQIPLYENIPSVSGVTAVATAPVTATVALAGGTTGYPQYATQTPATIATAAPPAAQGLLTACSTTLLFPYVVNSGGYDTGIALSNASTGTGLAAVTATAGSCVVAFYGDNGTTTAPVSYNTGTIPTGKVVAFTVSDKSAGLTGYVVATCNFQGAHGYAFVTDGFGGGGRGLSAD